MDQCLVKQVLLPPSAKTVPWKPRRQFPNHQIIISFSYVLTNKFIFVIVVIVVNIMILLNLLFWIQFYPDDGIKNIVTELLLSSKLWLKKPEVFLTSIVEFTQMFKAALVILKLNYIRLWRENTTITTQHYIFKLRT
jgi:hypothetical protein